MIRRSFRPLLLTAAAVLVCASAWLAPVERAAAQVIRARMAGPGMRGAMRPAVNQRQLDRFAEMLGLTADQREAAAALLDGYCAEHEKVAKAMSDTFKRAQRDGEDSGDMVGSIRSAAESIKAHAESAERLEKQFFTDLKSLLDPAQTDRWPRVERAHRRNRELPQGQMAGENVDLVRMVSALNLESRPEDVDQVLDRYEGELDAALTARSEALNKARQSMEDPAGGAGGGFDMAKIQKSMQTMAALMKEHGLKVREINERYARLVEPMVPPDRQPELAEAIRKQTFRGVYREAYVNKAMTAAHGLTDLEPEQKASLASLAESYERDVKGVNRRWSEAIWADEAENGPTMMRGLGAMMGGGRRPDSPADAARKARRELDDVTVERLKSLLNQEQITRLPDPEEETGPRGPMMMFGGGAPADDEE